MARKQSNDDLVQLQRLRSGPLDAYGHECVKIKSKEGKIVPFQLNDAQRLLDGRIEEQLAKYGFVRVLVLKGRQQGVSTYVAVRFYRKTSMFHGVNTYILSHEQASADNLFDYVDRIQRHNPLAPHVGVSNEKELVFDRLDSNYQVATAGEKATGRGRALKLYHGSEVAFWKNAPAHFASSVQGVAMVAGSEIILESTANGPGGEFYERWQMAEAGIGDYIAVFIPWFVSSEYSREPEPGFELSEEAEEGEMSEAEYAETYGLSLGQMAWRRAKIAELRSPELFRQEYPATAVEAWVTAGHDPFIKPLDVMRARKRTHIEGAGPLIFGVDPASMGGDRFAIAARRGPRVEWVKTRTKIDAEEGKAWLRALIDQHKPARVFIDAGNDGHAIVSWLKNLAPYYLDIVRGVHFGATSQLKTAQPKHSGPKNRRGEMYERLRDWLKLPEGVRLPDSDSLMSDLTAARMKPQVSHDWLLESKKDLKSRGVRSPDEADAVALTFASLEFITHYEGAPRVNTFGNPDAPRAPTLTSGGFGEINDGYSGEHGWLGY